MRKGISNFFVNFFSGRRNSENAGTPKEVYTTETAQPNVLRDKMKEKQLTHGETVMVNLSPVRLESTQGRMRLYFCPMKNLEVLKTITPGDGNDIPYDVAVEGLTIPVEYRSGLYTLKNVRLSSNGKMQVIADKKTTWEQLEPNSAWNF